jgi:hypothetical protein
MKLSDLFPAADPWVQNLPNLFPAWIAADSEWMLALFGAMHLLALAGMGGCSLVLGLRLMGVTLKTIPTADLYRSIKPWLWGAVILGLATGTIMGMATATRNYSSPVFSLKVMSIIAGVILTFGTVGVIARADRKDLGLSRTWAMIAANAWLLIALGFLMQGQTYWAFNMVVLGGVASAAPSGAGRKPVIWITGLGLLAILLMNIVPTFAFYEKNVFELDALGQPIRQIFQSNGKPVVEKIFYWHLLSADTRNGLLGFVTVVFSESLRIAVNRRIFATETETQAATITYGFAMALWLMTMWLFADSFDGKPGASLIAAAAFLFAVGLSGFRTRAALIGIVLILAITVATIAYSQFPLEIKCPIPASDPDQGTKCDALILHNKYVFNAMHVWAVRAMSVVSISVIGWQMFGPNAKTDASAIAKMVGVTTFIVWLTVGALGRWIAFAS